MLKKLVSNALLSVVMDKDARQKLKDRRTDDSAPNKPSQPGKSSKPSRKTPDRVTSGEDVVDTIAEALAEARAEVSGKKKPSAERPAEGSLQEKRSRPPAPSATTSPPRRPADKRPSTPERERLIQEAMAIHRQKSHVLDDLDPEAREKLMVMAMYAMDPDSLPPEARAQAKADAEADGLVDGRVDEIGGNARTKKKRPLPPRT